MSNYDTILVVKPDINEAFEPTDRRTSAKSNRTNSVTRGRDHISISYIDPKYYSANAFGQRLRQTLHNMNTGFSSKVTDFGQWVTAEVTYHDSLTGRSASKTFLIVFMDGSDGIVLSTHNRYRTISGVEQAASYIMSACSALRNGTSSQLG
jgi:hypothetical protein